MQSLPGAQAGMELPELWPSVGHLVPALNHECVEVGGAVLGARQQLARPYKVNDLLVSVTIIGL